jgi:DNA primase
MHIRVAVEMRRTDLLLASEWSVHGLWGKDLREEDAAVNDAVGMEIESLRNLKTSELRTRYRDLFGEVSPSFNREHLFRRIAWRLQAKAEGELSERARQRAAELANDSDLRLRAPQSFWGEIERNSESPNRDPRLPPAGTVLERVYQGQILRVTILANGFEYHGKHYASLSAIAHRVTGTRWNGFHFFGLKQEWKHE